jgi:hypothetical protein
MKQELEEWDAAHQLAEALPATTLWPATMRKSPKNEWTMFGLLNRRLC